MKRHPYRRALIRIERHYTRLLRRCGDTPEAAQWKSRDTRDTRFRVLTGFGVPEDAKVLDFGCGTGELLRFLRHEHGYTGEYVGWDLSEDTLAAARKKFPGVRFERRDVFDEGVAEDFDFVFISGVFNNDHGHNEAFMRDTLRLLFRHTRQVLAFNALSAWAGPPGAGLYSADPCEVFLFCHEHLSPLVALRHDYLFEPLAPPRDFTVFVRRHESGRAGDTRQ